MPHKLTSIMVIINMYLDNLVPHKLTSSIIISIFLYYKDSLLINHQGKKINKVELDQHLREMRLDIEHTTKLEYNYPYPECINKLHPIPRGIKVVDFKQLF